MHAFSQFRSQTQVTLDVEADGSLVDGEGNARSLVGEELRASNGFAHAVDGVLFPPDLLTLAESKNAEGGAFEGVFGIFLAGVARTGLAPVLSGVNGLYTVSFVGAFCLSRDRAVCLCAVTDGGGTQLLVAIFFFSYFLPVPPFI